MSHADANQGVFLPPSAFAAAFPFHIVFGPDMLVRQAGATIARVLPDLRPGVPLRDHFRLVRPPSAFDFASLVDHPQSVVLLEALARPLRLKGQMLHLPDQDAVAFLCSPVTTDIRSVSELGLAMDDFAVHDSTIDFMLVLQSAQTTLADLQATTQLLRAERSQLRQARARLQHLLQASPTVIYACPGVAPYDLTFISENATRLFGDPALANPQLLFDHTHPDDRDDVRAAFDTAVRDGSASIVYRLRVGDGYRWHHDLIEASTGDGGIELVGASHDVHQLIETERALDDSNSRSRAMLDTAHDGVIALDDEGRVLEFNGSATRIFGCERSQALGAQFVERFIPEKSRPAFRTALLGAAASGVVSPAGPRTEPTEGVPQDITACTWDGREFPAELSLTRVERRHGAIYVGFVRDITDRHVAMSDLLKARDDAEMANLAKSEFLARMSHEIRTPLHAILGMTELALASQLTREQRDYLESVRSSSDALLYLINDLLDFSKIEAGQMRIEQSTFDVWELLEGVTDATAVKATAKGLRVTCWIDPDVPRQIAGDPNRLRQIVTNLMGNAVKFTDTGEVVLRVSVETGADAGAGGPHLRMSVSDTGRGIADADQGRVFDRFFQADRSNTNHVAGTGLGLSITQTLVGLMGGTIGIDSRVGHGTRFDVRLPLHDVPRQTRQRTWSNLPAAPVMVAVSGQAEHGMIRCHLEYHGCEVHVVATAAEALAALGARHYAAMVIDHELPDQTGLELIRTIRSERTHDAVRLVLLSTVPSPQLIGAVVSDCVVKPLHADRLLDSLDEARTAARQDGAPAPQPTLAPGDPERPPRILVAEDNPENQRVATRLLEGAGAQVQIAPDGRAAVDMAAKTRYDLILMDLQMPVLDGSQASVAIRDAERLRDEEPVPIVAFTAHAVEGFRQQCLAAGMNDYIVKPITGRDLVDTVHRWVDRRPAVLVADDAPEIRQLVKLRLKDSYRIVQASNGREALEQFGRQPISLVLLDMNMPVLDGYATAAAIRLREDGRQVPIVALTGAEGQDAHDRAVAAGCTMHLAKPVRLATLFSTVEAAMRQGAQPVVEPERPEPSLAPVLLDIDPLLADLVPGYIREKRRQMADLRRLVTEGDMDRLKRIAHDIKGTGAAYGVPDVTRLGRALETAGQQGDASLASSLVEELDTLLARVQVQLGVA